MEWIGGQLDAAATMMRGALFFSTLPSFPWIIDPHQHWHLAHQALIAQLRQEFPKPKRSFRRRYVSEEAWMLRRSRNSLKRQIIFFAAWEHFAWSFLSLEAPVSTWSMHAEWYFGFFPADFHGYDIAASAQGLEWTATGSIQSRPHFVLGRAVAEEADHRPSNMLYQTLRPDGFTTSMARALCKHWSWSWCWFSWVASALWFGRFASNYAGARWLFVFAYAWGNRSSLRRAHSLRAAGTDHIVPQLSSLRAFCTRCLPKALLTTPSPSSSKAAYFARPTKGKGQQLTPTHTEAFWFLRRSPKLSTMFLDNMPCQPSLHRQTDCIAEAFRGDRLNLHLMGLDS